VTDNTRTRHKTIPLVFLSHTDKRMHAINKLVRASVIVHLLPAHLYYISISKTISSKYSNATTIWTNFIKKNNSNWQIILIDQ
jgi:hypothetical protein